MRTESSTLYQPPTGGKPETLEAWREAWAALCNAKFEEKGLPDRIDHRSYERHGVEQHPTVHEGVAVRQMEARGLVTNKGERNRWIKSANTMLRALRDRIKSLATWLTSTRVKLESTPSLEKLLMEYMDEAQRRSMEQQGQGRQPQARLQSRVVPERAQVAHPR